MKLTYLLFFGAFFLIYGAINYYIGLRGWQAFGRLLPHAMAIIYWLLLFLIASAIFVSMFGRGVLPEGIRDVLAIAGSFWLAVVLYLFLVLVAIDFLRLINRWLRIIPDLNPAFLPLGGFMVLLLVGGLIAYGMWNAQNTQISSFDVTIGKNAGETQQMQVVVVSDIHIGSIIDKKRVSRMVEQINALHPDLILMPGDLIDGNLTPYLRQNIHEELMLLKPRYGTFAVFGNHDYMGGIADEAERLLDEAGITVLRDSYQLVADSFYVVGREDYSAGQNRLALATIMADLDPTKPVVLLDHQPFDLAEGQRCGVDLQVSGHTHHGQLFPFNLITNKLFEEDWGHLKKDAYQVIVSCGYGTWGPPLRIRSHSEIVSVTVNFAP
jgi:predicted MPP superfamily phosphohydrolase